LYQNGKGVTDAHSFLCYQYRLQIPRFSFRSHITYT